MLSGLPGRLAVVQVPVGSLAAIMSGWKPQRKTLEIIAAARQVIEAASYHPTLRRVFYELVSAGTIPNDERAYKNLSYQLDMARWEIVPRGGPGIPPPGPLRRAA